MESADQTLQWANTEASRCLFCIDAPCIKGCPAQIDVPQFIRLLRWKDIKGAKEIIKTENCFGTLCGYLCPSEELCEKNCVRSMIDSPIKIAALQRFACDNSDYRHPIEARGRTGKRVAVIGAGPSGLSCAVQLNALGHNVEIFERETFATGTISKEIPDFKIPPEVIDKELSELGIDKIKIRFGVEVDRKLLENEIGKEYNAVFLAVGLSQSRRSEFNNENLKNVYNASTFLKSVKGNLIKQMKGISVIIGGGDTAIDCARTALRLGAKRSIIAYRRSKNEMPAAEAEFIQAGKEGVEVLWQVSPVRLIGKKKVAEIEFVRTELVPSRTGGKRKVKRVLGSKFKFPGHVVVLALGKDRGEEIASILHRPKQTVNPETLQIGNTKFFAGGDFINWGKTVVEAVAHGKKAAWGIDRYLDCL
jgi:dihydropyrimidine dehydrogenase (NAD+) subunit PreT